MLNGRISTQDEEDVEDELAAMEARINAEKEAQKPAAERHNLPVAPDTELTTPEGQTEPQPERAKEPERRQMLAA